jgi:pimeloyl-ACP methyl ester carboxylesterase
MGEITKIIKVVLFVFTPLWLMFAPLAIVMYVILLPFSTKPRAIASQNVSVKIVGNQKGKEIVFVHGWPDSGNLWNKMLPYFKDYRCIVLTMPYCDAQAYGGQGLNFSQITLEIAACVDKHRKNQKEKPIWIAHDWGTTHTYNVYKVRPDLIRMMAVLDVAPKIDMSISMFLFVTSYQFFNVFCWYLGDVGTYTMRLAMWFAGYRGRPIGELHSSMNYNYYWLWKCMLFGSKNEKRAEMPPPLKYFALDRMPVYYAFGLRKLKMFHSKKWIALLRKNAKTCQVSAFDCDHWIPIHKAPEVSAEILAWITKTPIPGSPAK